jgi:DNA-binding FadR family transcriptional regulator
MIPRARLNADDVAFSPNRQYLALVNKEHKNVLAAIKAKKPEAARQAMREHLAKGRERRMASLGS